MMARQRATCAASCNLLFLSPSPSRELRVPLLFEIGRAAPSPSRPPLLFSSPQTPRGWRCPSGRQVFLSYTSHALVPHALEDLRLCACIALNLRLGDQGCARIQIDMADNSTMSKKVACTLTVTCQRCSEERQRAVYHCLARFHADRPRARHVGCMNSSSPVPDPS